MSTTSEKKQLIVFGSPKTVCPMCRKIEAMVDEIMQEHGEKFDYRKRTLDSDEAVEMGILMTPCVVFEGNIIVLGDPIPMSELKKALLGQ